MQTSSVMTGKWQTLKKTTSQSNFEICKPMARKRGHKGSFNSIYINAITCLPLKHCIHFLLSSLCPPTSNILQRWTHTSFTKHLHLRTLLRAGHWENWLAVQTILSPSWKFFFQRSPVLIVFCPACENPLHVILGQHQMIFMFDHSLKARFSRELRFILFSNFVFLNHQTKKYLNSLVKWPGPVLRKSRSTLFSMW